MDADDVKSDSPRAPPAKPVPLTDSPRVPLAEPVPPTMSLAEPVPLTDQQRRAIAARDVSVALSAGAGCGKTFVLTERFLSHLEPSRPDSARLGQMVAITFTERAAREMRDRIREKCRKRLIECPEEEAGHWLELLRELDSARISTIHSFCASLLRGHAVEAGLDPRFRVLDQLQADTLLNEKIDDQLRERLAEQDESVLDLIVQFGLRRLATMIAQLLCRRQEIDWARWLSVNAGSLVLIWGKYHREKALPLLLQKIVASDETKTLLEIARLGPSLNPEMKTRMAFLLEALPGLAGVPDPSSALDRIREAAKVQGAGSKKDWTSVELQEKFRKAAEKLRKTIDTVKGKMDFDPEKALPAAETGLRLLALAGVIGQVYEKEKHALAALDFNDLLIRAAELMTGPDHEQLRKRWAANLRLLLVDEFQDTDPLQVQLVKALCDNQISSGKLFFVGDFKQSIYRFRGADPRVFHSLREEIPQEGRLPLSLNFRSQPAVLDFVNALFREEFLEYEALCADRPQTCPLPTVEFLWAMENEFEKDKDGPTDSDSADRLSAAQANLLKAGDESGADDQTPSERRRRREADWIARRIRGMIDSGEKIVCDKVAAKTGNFAARAVKFGDIALLFRALTDVEYYEAALRRYDIPYYLVGGHAFYAQQEIFDLLNLLRSLESACDPVSLLGALRSPFFNLLDETIFWLARQPGGLYSGLFFEKLSPQIGGEQKEQVEFAAQTLAALRAMKDHMPIARLIEEAIDRTAYDAVLLAEFMGERKLANLYKLIDQARSFDNQPDMFTLSDFIAQLAQFVANQPDEPLAATQSETMDVVRLMTIHQAKGLEFPLVFVPDLARSFQSSRASVAFSRELGPLVKDDEAAVGYDLFALEENEQTRDETTRLLYVAATRAADYLVLSAGVENFKKAGGTWMELLVRRFDLSTGKAHKTDLQVKVTNSKPPLESEPPDAAARQRLEKILKNAQKKAEKGEGRLPKYLAPIPPDKAARRQFSFSRLSGALREQKPLSTITYLETDDLLEPAPDPLGIGTLTHAALEEIDFAGPGDFEAIIRRLAPLHLGISADVNLTIDMIGRFLASPRAAQITAAKEVHRELEFLLAWPPDEPLPGGRYLQGFIDCLYRDQAGDWHIVDYKTNNITAQNLEQEAGKYEMQMLVYALAAEKILKQPPAELVLCFLRPGLEYQFPWSDKARKRALGMVNQCLP